MYTGQEGRQKREKLNMWRNSRRWQRGMWSEKSRTLSLKEGNLQKGSWGKLVNSSVEISNAYLMEGFLFLCMEELLETSCCRVFDLVVIPEIVNCKKTVFCLLWLSPNTRLYFRAFCTWDLKKLTLGQEKEQVTSWQGLAERRDSERRVFKTVWRRRAL